jgi:Tfp pilus assembly protein PilV
VPSSHSAGLTLVEVVFSTLIVAVMTVVALNALGAATRSSVTAANRAIALGLADDLMAEVLANSYSGLAAYANWSEDLTGDREGWTRNVAVQRVVPGSLTQETAGATDLGAKRVRVFIEFEGIVLAEQIAVCTDTD